MQPPSTERATALVDELIGCGLTDVVLCPGSRSAPLAYAVLAAERAGRVRLHVRVDERSAGFLALGLAKVSRVPAAVVTTSGTAVANLHPAVLEAHHAGVPLIVLSADRPRALRWTGANQTTVQPGMFAGAVRLECDLDDAAAADLGGWRAAARDAYDAATGRGGYPGPAHINAPFAEPLVPELTADPPAADLSPRGPAPSPVGEAPGGPDLGLPERTVVVVGDLPEPGQAARAIAWAAGLGLPAVAEPFGDHPRPGALAHGVLVLDLPGFVDALAPECVVVVGRPTLSRPVTALVNRPDIDLVVVTAGAGWRSPAHPEAPVHPFGETVVPRPGRGPGPWARRWLDAGTAVERVLATEGAPLGSGTELVRALLAALPDRALLFLGSSKTVRDVDAGMAPRTRPLTVVASRGLAGIDGVVSTAIGVALSAPERPAYALLGDLTFVHDANGLLVGPDEARPDLTVIVVNDDGGGIFTILEPGDPARSDGFERVFGTSTGTDIGALCRAHGVRHDVVAGPEELASAVTAPPSGMRVVEVRADRSRHRADQEALRRIAARAAG